MFLPNVSTIAELAPLSWIYSTIVSIRNKMFDRDILHVESFEDRVAVIGVGNIAVGGTGKTPHTEYIVRLLLRHGIGPVAVLSRGYKRRSRGFVLAGASSTANKLGDESFQLYRKFPNVIIAVDANRVHGIRSLLNLPEPPKAIVLDDVFQHRYVKPGLNICLTSYHRILYSDKVLPAGRLREPAIGVQRADMLIVTKCPNALREEETTEIHATMPTRPGQPIFYSSYRYCEMINLFTNQEEKVDPTSEVLVVTGIADPTDFTRYVSAHFRLLDSIAYSDHHHFSSHDVREMQRRLDSINQMGYCTNNSGKKAIIITTEKDAARLVKNSLVPEELLKRIYYIPTEVYFLEDHAEKIDQLILDYVNKPRNNGNQ